MITFNQVTECLTHYKAVHITNYDSDSFYSGIRFLSCEDKKPQKEYIYVGYTSEWVQREEEFIGIDLLLIEDSSLVEKNTLVEDSALGSFHSDSNIAVYPTRTDLLSLFSEANSLFDAENTLQTNSAKMLSLLRKGKNLQDLIQVATDMLDNPVLLPDSSGRLLAVSYEGR